MAPPWILRASISRRLAVCEREEAADDASPSRPLCREFAADAGCAPRFADAAPLHAPGARLAHLLRPAARRTPHGAIHLPRAADGVARRCGMRAALTQLAAICALVFFSLHAQKEADAAALPWSTVVAPLVLLAATCALAALAALFSVEPPPADAVASVVLGATGAAGVCVRVAADAADADGSPLALPVPPPPWALALAPLFALVLWRAASRARECPTLAQNDRRAAWLAIAEAVLTTAALVLLLREASAGSGGGAAAAPGASGDSGGGGGGGGGWWWVGAPYALFLVLLICAGCADCCSLSRPPQPVVTDYFGGRTFGWPRAQRDEARRLAGGCVAVVVGIVQLFALWSLCAALERPAAVSGGGDGGGGGRWAAAYGPWSWLIAVPCFCCSCWPLCLLPPRSRRAAGTAAAADAPTVDARLKERAGERGRLLLRRRRLLRRATTRAAQPAARSDGRRGGERARGAAAGGARAERRSGDVTALRGSYINYFRPKPG